MNVVVCAIMVGAVGRSPRLLRSRYMKSAKSGIKELVSQSRVLASKVEINGRDIIITPIALQSPHCAEH